MISFEIEYLKNEKSLKLTKIYSLETKKIFGTQERSIKFVQVEYTIMLPS